GVDIQYSVQTEGVPSCDIDDSDTPTVTFSATGTCVIRATASEGGKYQSATTDVTLTVTKTAQTITFTAPGDKTYGDSSFSLTASASSSESVTVTHSDADICTVSGTTVTIVSVGTCTLTASQSGTDSYAAATDVVRSFTIAPKALTMTVSIDDKDYDGSSAATVASPSLSGLVSDDSVSVVSDEITAAFANPDAGSSKPVSVTLGDGVLSGDRSDRYTVTVASTPTASINKVNQATLSFASASSMTFGESLELVAIGGSGSGGLSYDYVSGPCSVTDSTVTTSGAGSCVVTATRAASTNYNAQTTSNFTITVNKANQSINFTSSVPVSAVSGTTYTPTATATSGETVSFDITTGRDTVCSISSGVVTFLTSGTCVIEASQSEGDDYNAAPSVTQTIVAGKINQTISFPAISGKDFDDPAFSAGASVSSDREITYATSTSSVCGVDSSTGVINIKTVGDCTVTASSAGDDSYAAASDVTRTFTISPVLAGKPSITSVSFGDSSVTVAFGAPGSTGGDAIDGYQVVATSSGGSVTKPDCSTTSPCTITGLTNGEAYTLTIAAINAAGVGPASDSSPSITPATIPDSVSALATTPGDEQLVVNWSKATSFGGGTFTEYELFYRVRGNSWSSPVSISTVNTETYTITGLTNGTAYDVKVVTISSVNGEELSSNTATALGVPATVPDAPTGLTLTALSNTTAAAAWTAPLDDGGATISGYNANLTCSFDNATDAFCSLTGLTAGSRVTFTVGATNLIGTGSVATVAITMPGGSSGSDDDDDDRQPTTTPAPPRLPTAGPGLPGSPRLPLPPSPAPRPEVMDGPFQPPNPPTGTGPRAYVGGVPAPVTSTPRNDGGVDVQTGTFRLGLLPGRPPGQGTTIPAGGGVTLGPGQDPELSGGGLLPGSSLQVFLSGGDGREIGRVPVHSDGTFEGGMTFAAGADERPLPVGPTMVQMVGYDAEGNQTVVEIPVNIAQGAPAPEPNREVGQLPDLVRGQSLATSAGIPEAFRVTAFPEPGRVEMTNGEWTFAVTVGEDGGEVRDQEGSAEVRLVQERVARASGSGFQAATRVDVWLFSEPTLLGSVIVAEDGSFDTDFYLDGRFATVGDHTLQLQGVGPDGYTKAVNLGVTIEQPPAPPTVLSAGSLVLWSTLILLALALLAVTLSRRWRRAEG
ncbi:fibronectin type III domain-containing protein, partial [Pontimonas sp.]|uniref:fibronectin type III domain-containing protein n=1 Tax=Pontimonas sp. TaxID=2304492 RepID=UPI0028700E4B